MLFTYFMHLVPSQRDISFIFANHNLVLNYLDLGYLQSLPRSHFFIKKYQFVYSLIQLSIEISKLDINLGSGFLVVLKYLVGAWFSRFTLTSLMDFLKYQGLF